MSHSTSNTMTTAAGTGDNVPMIEENNEVNNTGVNDTATTNEGRAPPARKRRQTSEAWNHFERIPLSETKETMAEEEPKPLNYIPEIILKKRKSSEAWALRKRDQLQQKKFLTKNSKDYIKKPEDFIIEYRNKELDLIRMNRRVKRTKKQPELLRPNSNSKLLLIIRIQGKNDMHPKTRKVLNKLNLRRIFSAVFVKASVGIMAKLQKVEPYVTYGYPNLKTIKELIYKKGFAKIDNQKVPLTDNNIIEQALGKYGIVCIEDMVHEIVNVGPHFIEVASFLWPFELNKPTDGLRGSKTLYKDGGDTGNRNDLINELVDKMN